MSDTLTVVTTDHMLYRIRSEYLEMPGLQLTRRQAQRLWGLDERICGQLLDLLTESRFLHRNHSGMYSRLTEGAVAPPLRMAHAAPAEISTLSSRVAASVRN